jgi:hypothetical protein
MFWACEGLSHLQRIRVPDCESFVNQTSIRSGPSWAEWRYNIWPDVRCCAEVDRLIGGWGINSSAAHPLIEQEANQFSSTKINLLGRGKALLTDGYQAMRLL